MLKKRNLFLVVLLIFSLAIVAHGAEYPCKLASDEPVGTPKYEGQEMFIDRVAELTNNEVQITIYPSNQLGSSRELIEAAQMGAIQGVAVPTSTVTGFEPKMSIFDLPFLFPTPEIGYQVIESEVGDEVLATLLPHDLVGVSFYGSGWKQLTGNFEITGPESYKGKKIRVMENPILIAQFEALGANAIPINFGELYNALQQNVVDGQENPIVTCYEMKFYEVQDYMALSYHAYLPNVYAFNKDWFYSLPEEYQKALGIAGKEMDKWLREAINNQELSEFLPKMKEFGLQVLELDQADREEYSEVIQQPTRTRFLELTGEIGKDLLQKVDDKIAELQK
ncbi:hypothetical protein ES705_03991 [subsurface metagenome]